MGACGRSGATAKENLIFPITLANLCCIEARNHDLKAVNPNARTRDDGRSPSDLLDLIEAKGQEVADALARLRALQ